MNFTADIDALYQPSENVISKDIEGQFMIVPLISGVGNLNEEIFQLNTTGSAFWKKLDGKTSLRDIMVSLTVEFDAPYETIETDIIRLVDQLIKKKFIFEVR
ncbi:MAG: PqqD family protein [Desulfobacula sp.]|nr:PqqD family protein [Desulfobacula sp.]